MKLIKRYKNRRLYDVEASRTITQTELAAIVKAGHDVKIIDSTTEKDISLEVLGRVMISETSSWGDITESKELFIKLISIGGDRSMSVLKNTILASIGAFNVTKAKAEKIIDDLIKKGDLNKSDRKKAVMELLDKAEKSTAQLKDKISKGADKTQKEVTKMIQNLNVAKRTDFQKLEAKVDKLNKALKNIEKKLSEL
ncbi:polyhydroxyalkanoate synthesis regulator DNA-binding domain-containing protein [Candidatus Zixiibacteriota bacterium]